jgi:serine/threonine protein kinase
MGDFLKWLASNPVMTGALVVLLGVLMLMFVVAFFQGREISLWPPKIGPRPNHASAHESDAAHDSDGERVGSNPIVGRGTILKTASGDKVMVESDFYGGANATLFRGKNSAAQQVIAKVFWRGLAPNSPPWELFKQEQRTAEILIHRNIVRILDRGLFGGYPFTIMEYMGGGTLRDCLRTYDRIPGEDILSVAGQVADAIGFAHSHGVVHRDIKPGNILFESDAHGRVALSDFGIARILGAVEKDITAAEASFVGSPGYLAPETLEDREPSKASDIYGFGVVLYEMIAGRIPFEETRDGFAVIRAKLDQDAPDIRKYRPDVPERIAVRLAQTLNRDPSARPDSARAVLSGIEKEIALL